MVFVLASLAAVFTVSLVVSAPPKKKPGGGAADLSLSVIIGADGYYVKGAAAGVGPGCSGIGAGVTVPRVTASAAESFDGRKFDPLALKRCARKLKDESSGDERQVIVTANPNVPFAEVVRAMDALRSDERGALFPEVILAVR